LLACDVDRKEPQYDLYGWWPGPDKPPVLIFSTKGLELDPKGEATDRVIANAVVSNIAGHLVDVDHPKGPKDCVNYWNPKRDPRILTGKQRFCAKCESLLKKEHPAKLKALKAILREFD